MSLLFYKFSAAIVLFLVTILAVFYPFRAKAHPGHGHFLDFGDAFASGIFLGAALFHMLPESSTQLHELFPAITYPLASLLCAGGFLLLLFLERLAVSTSKHELTIPYVLGIVIIIHSFIEGSVIGINTNLVTLSIIFLAVLAHKGSESFALSMALSKKTNITLPVAILIGVFSVMTPIGILSGTSIGTYVQATEGKIITAGFNAFAAGTFLYMSTLHHINHHQRLHEAESMSEFFCLLLGLCIMAVIALWT